MLSAMAVLLLHLPYEAIVEIYGYLYKLKKAETRILKKKKTSKANKLIKNIYKSKARVPSKTQK